MGTHSLRALQVLFCKNYRIIVIHFEHSSQARDSSAQMQGRAKNYSKKLKSFKFLKFMHLLLDVIEEVSKASLFFQRDDVTVSAVQLKIDTLCGALDAMNLRPGEHVRSFCAEITDDNVFKGIHLTRENGDDASYTTIKTGILSQEIFQFPGGSSPLWSSRSKQPPVVAKREARSPRL